ncbi:MAG: dienelactone hydrolase family protein [Janthinobacterium lividum]
MLKSRAVLTLALPFFLSVSGMAPARAQSTDGWGAPAPDEPYHAYTRPLQNGSIARAANGLPLEADNGNRTLLPLSPDLNEQVINVPERDDPSITLETTIFKPDGPGPFPMVVFNHGKERGDPRFQSRSRPLAFAREFVRRGYVVVAPNRRGFAHSGGVYAEDGCDVAENGLSQAQDVAATVEYMSRQSYVDAAHVVVAGASHGGLTTMAYGDAPQRGVRGLINFSGGLRQDGCAGWQSNLSHAFGAYGQHARVPSLWIYGDNDSFWSRQLATQMFTAYTTAGGPARMMDFGVYKDNAHRLVGDRDGVAIWWPGVRAFLASVGMPTHVRYAVPQNDLPVASGYAPVTAVEAVPFVSEEGRAGYRSFLSQYPTRAFAISNTGAWAWAEGGDDPVSTALDSCQRNSRDPCKLYAVNERVVWQSR